MSAEPRTIVVVAPNWLGDAVMATPAIADVRRRFPDSRLVVAARRAVADLFQLVPGIDEVVVLEWQGRWWTSAARRADVARMTNLAAGAALLLPNSFATAWLVSAAGVPERWGYARDLRGRLLTLAVAPPRGSLHQASYYQHLTNELGVPAGPLQPALVASAGAAPAARALLEQRGWDGERPVIVLAPGAAYGTAKRWIPSHVAMLASRLVAERGATCVLVGSAADRPTTTAVRGAIAADRAAHVIDVAGDTSLATLAGVFTLARACVANDSGAMHMAAALGTPVTALFGPTREHETAPLAADTNRTLVLTHPVWCRPCMLRECPLQHGCMRGVAPERVAQAAREQFDTTL